jgi:hypothetical protein
LSTNPYLAAESCSLFPLEKSLFVKDIPLLILAGISLGAAAAQGSRCRLLALFGRGQPI